MLASFNQFHALLAAQSGGTVEARAHQLQSMMASMLTQTGTPLDNNSPVKETTEIQRQSHPPHRAQDQPNEEAGMSENDTSEGREGGNPNLAADHMPG